MDNKDNLDSKNNDLDISVLFLCCQLRNAVHDLEYGHLQQLHEMLERLKGCKGSRECTIRTRPSSGMYPV